jgi:hypothetical protein
MRSTILFGFLLLAAPAWAQADSQWILDHGTLQYHVSHPLHQVDGTSHAARGKGSCDAGLCSFLVAAPVKSFDSGDSNRDLHMLQVVRGGEFPIVSVRTQLPVATAKSTDIHANLDIEFAGQTVQYKQVPFQLLMQGNEAKLTGTIPAKLSDFKIDPPSLLAIPVKNDIPVYVELVWKRQK